MKLSFSLTLSLGVSLFLGSFGSSFLQAAEPAPLQVNLRSRTQPFKGSEEWDEVKLQRTLDPKECAIILCDTWDKHWCPKATERCDVLAKKMATLVVTARKKGMTIVHAPSDCMDFYKNSPARKRLQDLPKTPLPKPLDLPDPICPVDSSDGGCDDVPQPKSYRAWTRQHASIVIDEENDGVSDQGSEIYNFLKSRGVKTIFMMGVHTNMCVLHRSFAIKPMSRLGMRCILVRDLTDSMYNPKMRPFVSHDEGTELIIQFIEKNWCPTCLSSELTK